MTHPDKMARTQVLVYLLEDDASVRRAFSRLLQTAGIEVREFGTVEEFLRYPVKPCRACVVADTLLLRGVDIDLPRRLHGAGRNIPVILVTTEEDGRTLAAAKSAGAVSFFHKPVDGQALIDAVEWAVSDPKPLALPDQPAE
ncbi:MAG: response regulator [Pseudomonadota bacterium]|nr:response regulator [Pseudomonadota bacterium]